MKEQEGAAKGRPGANPEGAPETGPCAPDCACGGIAGGGQDERLIRLQADFENYKKRMQRELAEAAETGKKDLLLKLLNLADTFDLALLALGKSPADKEMLRGVEMLRAHLNSILAEEGVAPFGAAGETFDPFRHDALEYVAGGEDGKVAEVIQLGYLWRGGVLRHAVVKVSRIVGKEKEMKQEDGENNRN